MLLLWYYLTCVKLRIFWNSEPWVICEPADEKLADHSCRLGILQTTKLQTSLGLYYINLKLIANWPKTDKFFHIHWHYHDAISWVIVFFCSIFVLVLLHCLFHTFVVIVYYIIINKY